MCSPSDVTKRRDLRRAHVLAPEDQFGNLNADLRVVDDEGGLACIVGKKRRLAIGATKHPQSQAGPFHACIVITDDA